MISMWCSLFVSLFTTTRTWFLVGIYTYGHSLLWLPIATSCEPVLYVYTYITQCALPVFIPVHSHLYINGYI